jgi:hypothetical protein
MEADSTRMKKSDTTKAKESAPETAPVNTFATTLAQLGKGASLAELSAELTKVVTAVRTTHKAAELKYKIKIVPVKGTDGTQVIVTDDVSVKMPSNDRKPTLFFTDEDGSLSRKDPNQRDWLDEAEANAGGQPGVVVAAGAVISKEDLKASGDR